MRYWQCVIQGTEIQTWLSNMQLDFLGFVVCLYSAELSLHDLFLVVAQWYYGHALLSLPISFPRFFGCGIPFPARLEGCRVLDLGSGSGRDSFAFSKLVGTSGHVTGIDMTEELVITRACTHSICNLISVLPADLSCTSSDHSVSSVHWVSSEEVWVQGAQRVFCPGVYGEAQWGWHTKWLNGCCAVGLKHGHDLTWSACILFV